MADPREVVPLPQPVDDLIQRICREQNQEQPSADVRGLLASVGDYYALDIMRTISTQTIRKSLSGFIVWMVRDHHKQARESSSAESISFSPRRPPVSSPSSTASVNSPEFTSPSFYDKVSYSPISTHPSEVLSPSSSPKQAWFQEGVESPQRASATGFSEQLMALSELDFNKLFLILSYLGRKKLEDVISMENAINILKLKDQPMKVFESHIWSALGRDSSDEVERIEHADWDSGKTHLYHCHIYPDGHSQFKGPYLEATKTHLQRVLGDENVLTVKFLENGTYESKKIVEEGILVGLRRYHFFVFKDGGTEGKKKKSKERVSRLVKSYFVHMGSIAPNEKEETFTLDGKSVHDARCLFMHVHMVPTMAKYMARFSLILSKTIKLQIDLASTTIRIIEDIPCLDDDGCVIYDEDGVPQIHTDGTGYISEDLATKCPKKFFRAKYLKDVNFEKSVDSKRCRKLNELEETEVQNAEPPLLMQCRLFHNGLAVKGTLLVNKKLPRSTIEIRPSMIKVKRDTKLSNVQTFNSLEIVAVSHKIKRTYLSRYLIALLSYGGVPRNFFEDIVKNSLEEAQSVYVDERAALKVALNYGEIDDDFTSANMILSGIPLHEPFLQHRLSILAKEDKNVLKGGKLPITETFYLMGTADPTGELNNNEVCVILDNGPISGQVLVYRHPGLHFGDIHVLEAVYKKALEDVVGNAKYAIFFSTKGQRSAATEMANGDFDGDMYWVSRNPELRKHFTANEPWKRVYSTPKTPSRKPTEFSTEELEHQLFEQFLNSRIPSYVIGLAADSWLSFMDRLLILTDNSEKEKDVMKATMLQLIDMYYDAVDAPKSGKMVIIPDELKAEMYPHYMEKGERLSYQSTSVLGYIYDKVTSSQNQEQPAVDIWTLPCFDVKVSEQCMSLWRSRYETYRKEMSKALDSSSETKNDAANNVIKKYKKLLYGASEFEQSLRDQEEIYEEARAIYHVTYEYASSINDVRKCGFAWKVAGAALCKMHAIKTGEKVMSCVPSVLQKALS